MCDTSRKAAERDLMQQQGASFAFFLSSASQCVACDEDRASSSLELGKQELETGKVKQN